MKNNIYILFILFFHLSCSVKNQTGETNFKKIKGVVFDKYALEPIPFAEIKVKDKSKRTIERKVSSDFNGKFEIEARKGEILEISSLGFYSEQLIID